MLWCSFLAALLGLVVTASAGEPILFGTDGSVQLSLRHGSGPEERVALRFGLPAGPALKTWREGTAWRRLWVTNGIHYTQTLLLTSAEAVPVVGENCLGTNLILLVNIEGQNTNAEYTEATAELAFEVNGSSEPLLLENGLVWRTGENQRVFLGALEIAESGIASSAGLKLQFRGNMPPSLSGSMTLKLPLGDSCEKERLTEFLADLSFEEQFRRAARGGPPGASADSEPIALAEHRSEQSSTQPSLCGDAWLLNP